MRKMIILRGLPGSGKSTLARKAGLENHLLSADLFRRAFTGPSYSRSGEPRISQEQNSRIWRLVNESFEVRIKAGETIAFEARFDKYSDMKPYITRALEEGYKIHIVDLFGMDLDVIAQRNAERPVFERTYVTGTEADLRKASQEDIRTWFAKNFDAAAPISFNEEGDRVGQIVKFLEEPVIDLSDFRKVVHIGDLQGVHQALHADGRDGDGNVVASPVPAVLEDDVAYVFVGDALDRGIENGTLMKWILDEVLPRMGRNVFWVRGNHEIHLEYWANNRQSFSGEFNNRTLPQLIEAGVDRARTKQFVDGLVEYLVYTYHGKIVVALHGGFERYIDDMHMMASEQLMKGTGFHSTKVDASFDAWAREEEEQTGRKFYQVHGHRNSAMIAVDAFEYSFNLEGQPDGGGQLRMAVLDENGWSTVEIENPVYRHPFERQAIDRAERRQDFSPRLPNPGWV